MAQNIKRNIIGRMQVSKTPRTTLYSDTFPLDVSVVAYALT